MSTATVGQRRPAPGGRDPGGAAPATWATWWETSTTALVTCLVLLVAVPSALTYLHLSAYPELSVFDEQSHLDYVVKGPALLPVVSGDQWDPVVLRAAACRGVGNTFEHPPCLSADLSPGAFEQGGYNSAYIHPPLYYNVTAVLSDLVLATGVTNDPVNAARSIGAQWLSAGLLLAWAAGRRLGCRRVPLVAGLLVLGSTPGVVLQASTVNTDTANIFVGALLMLATTVADRRLTWASGLLVAVAAALAVAVRMQNIVVLIAAALFLLLRGIQRGGAGTSLVACGQSLVRDRAAATFGLLFFPAAAVAIAWNLIWPGMATVPPAELPFAVSLENPARMALDAVGKFLPIDLYAPPQTFALPSLVLLQLSNVIILGSLVVTLVAPRSVLRPGPVDEVADAGPVDGGHLRDPLPVLALGRSTLLAAAMAGAVLVALLYVVIGTAFQLQERYGGTLLPAMVVVVAAVWDDRWPARVLVVGAFASIAVETYVLTRA